ncbi:MULTISPECIES: hypothetical protein [unclassified Streptomyces]|uniref:hypothetical protein n=1 Tax=unclassified Streptomyces TaxID=2593676 RepID=UPI001F046169|nr:MULTISPECIES: hypothetical protein [unclassified Streptomyces]MCH0566452.1 hypothetical protein [Streptomyces sp. MUM 2J]MCH0571839.1 hypothetical protein [Streptomyces sp. MUM 136J]
MTYIEAFDRALADVGDLREDAPGTVSPVSPPVATLIHGVLAVAAVTTAGVLVVTVAG